MTETKEYFDRALAELDTLPPISNVFHKVLELTEGDDDRHGELVRCVSLDQAIAAKVLQIVNSAYYGLQEKISSLEVAVGLLGDKKVREIAILCSASGILRRGVRNYGIMPDEFWLHSIAAAISARLIADIYAPEKREVAFAAGLLHDIGKLAINRMIEEEHKETIRDTGDGPSPDYYAREMGLYGFDHCTIGFFLARNWKFSEEMTQAIAFHHYPDQESQHQDLIRIVCTADFLAHLAASGEDEGRKVEILEKEGMVPLDLSRPDIEKIISTLKKETSDSEAFLGI